ncbi:beta-ketoacyl synthase chain length factor [Serratia fonticola]|uniref:beta-ketoacyl synthase chain length factor n=1 Tax=Serratia fonticola TaxID=47917 RepID=UPI00192ADBEB|nr:beta-ketoacyl synthase chain length factor [Serratia fonticola]MBL5903779.1 beta-ketoacyl synthase chain length factor [Serratia fonticola]
MNFALNIVDWQAMAPGLSDASQWRQWSQEPRGIIPSAPQSKLTELPMMTARRLSSGSRLAVECGLAMLRRQPVDAVLYTSRHGELERNYRILQAIATQQAVSPTDFTMSVHNSAVGHLTIAAQNPLVSSSLSAGLDTFQHALCEVVCLLQAGYQRILMVDFDGLLPEFYHTYLPEQMPTWAYAVALVFERGNTLRCESKPEGTGEEPLLPQSLQFLQHYLAEEPTFAIAGERLKWYWSRT